MVTIYKHTNFELNKAKHSEVNAMVRRPWAVNIPITFPKLSTARKFKFPT
jgi:hypothetical protein